MIKPLEHKRSITSLSAQINVNLVINASCDQHIGEFQCCQVSQGLPLSISQPGNADYYVACSHLPGTRWAWLRIIPHERLGGSIGTPFLIHTVIPSQKLKHID